MPEQNDHTAAMMQDFQAKRFGNGPEVTQQEFQICLTKQIRKDLDATLQDLKKASEMDSSRERSLSITKIQEAIMWLGMDLKRLNPEGNPYPSSYDPASTKVEPVADGLKL